MSDFGDVQLKINALLDKVAENCNNAPSVEAFLQTGDTKLSHNVVSEAMYLDEAWIITIEQALFSIEQIVKNPQKSIIDEQVLVNVEKARKINAKSIQYLASHTQNISSITNGEIRPSKVMTTELAEDYKTYENRFVFTLIEKVNQFVRARHDEICARMNVHKTDIIEMENLVKVRGVEMKCGFRLEVRDVPRGSVEVEKNKELVGRIEVLLRRIKIIKASNFCAMLDSTKPVLAPIIKTNLITKNADYSNAYQLWLYVSAYTFQGYRVEIERKALPFDVEYYNDLSTVAALLWNVTEADNKLRSDLFDKIPAVERKKKNYRVLTQFNYEPTFGASTANIGDELLNQYYFDEMKKLIGKVFAVKKGATLVQNKNITMPFSKFYRALTKISNTIYQDVMKVEPTKITKKKKTHSDILKAQCSLQTETLRRSKTLSRLKAEELTKTLANESKELVKLEKLKFELALAEEKHLNKKAREKNKKTKLKAIKNKRAEALDAARETRESMVEVETERQELLLEQRRRKFTEIQELRERKQLQRLKEKYEKNEE